MKNALISNPPYNMRWQVPPFAQVQPRFEDCCIVPPESNANFAFVLTGLEKNERCVFLLPCSVLSEGTKEEKALRAWLVEKNFIEAVIICPDNMFESTGIATCIIVLDKNKKTATTEMVDLRQKYKEDVREQNGQYGGNSHTNRTYKKTLKVIPVEVMDEVLTAIGERKNIPDFCKTVSIQKMKENNYTLFPSHYLDRQETDTEHRSYADIVNDINRITQEKNACKLTLNESLAKGMGFDVDLYKQAQRDTGLEGSLTKLGADRLERQDYFAVSKKKNEIKFENNSKEHLSSILIMILNNWKQHIYYLNQEETRYLAELRDALLQDLMSGKVDIGDVCLEEIGGKRDAE